MLESMSMRQLFATLTFALLVTGCGGSGATSTPEPAFEGDPSQVLTITVHNEQLNEARVFLLIDRHRTRLGTVRAYQQETFHVPMTRVSNVHMEFDLTLGEHCVTTDVSVGPGDDIDVTIPSNLSMMAAACRQD